MLKGLNVTMCGIEFSKRLCDDFLGPPQLEVSSPPQIPRALLYPCTSEPLQVISYLSVSIFTSYLGPEKGKTSLWLIPETEPDTYLILLWKKERGVVNGPWCLIVGISSLKSLLNLVNHSTFTLFLCL